MGSDFHDWASSESYWTYGHIVESAWLEHGPFASWLVAAMRPRVIAELGTHNGYSYFAFCEAVSRLQLGTKCFAVDTWQGDDHAGFYGEDIFRLVTEVNDASYAGFSTLLRGNFDDYVGSFADGTIDLLHIDGRHGYEDALHDFETWLPKVSGHGVILFHDISVVDRGFGVWKLWGELSGKYPSFSFDHGFGLGVLGVGDTLAEPLARLFAASQAEIAAVRDFYSERGRLVGRLRAEETQRAVDREALAVAESDIESLRHELAGMRNSLAWKSTRPFRWLTGLVPLNVRRRIRSAWRGPS